ncbi:MAG: hypothetical protein DCC58_07105 [Chloroflexi bacterium]|nr:MAG: hypothetical protein DCC58_07105 [Chloroflexota bacterium]
MDNSDHRPVSRACARVGCRAWAMRGGRYCRSHLGDGGATGGDEDVWDERRLRAEEFAARVRQGARGDLVEQVVQAVVAAIGAEAETAGQGVLEGEIGALRLVLSRVVAVDALAGDPRDLALTVTRLVDAIVRAVKARQDVAATDTDTLDALTARVLDELDARDAQQAETEAPKWTDA